MSFEKIAIISPVGTGYEWDLLRNRGYCLDRVYYNSCPMWGATGGLVESGRGSRRWYAGSQGLNIPTHKQPKKAFLTKENFDLELTFKVSHKVTNEGYYYL